MITLQPLLARFSTIAAPMPGRWWVLDAKWVSFGLTTCGSCYESEFALVYAREWALNTTHVDGDITEQRSRTWLGMKTTWTRLFMKNGSVLMKLVSHIIGLSTSSIYDRLFPLNTKMWTKYGVRSTIYCYIWNRSMTRLSPSPHNLIL